jgi:acetyl esterase/lipase
MMNRLILAVLHLAGHSRRKWKRSTMLFFYQRQLLCIFLMLAAMGCSVVRAQQQLATHKDVAYGTHPAQKLDVYLAKSKTPVPAMLFIHGGGWRGGSKDNVPQWLLEAVRSGWMSVIAVEYRFTDVEPHPAQTNDCLRAVQFVRENATNWNIDHQRIGVTGGSAGGHLSLYIALHDDIADKESDDPVKRQSSRVACAVSFAGPTDWSLLSQIEHKHPAYRQLLGYAPGTAAEKMDAAAKIDVSPISFATQDDPPVMQIHGDKDDVVPLRHAENLTKRLHALGVTSELVIIKDGNHGVAGAAPHVSTQATEFVRKTLLIK